MSNADSTNGNSTPCNEDDACPVCLLNTNDGDITFCASPCKHILCKPCSERVLMSKDRNRHSIHDTQQDSILCVATKGKCPTCRRPLSLFDMVDRTTSQPAYPKNFDSCQWPMKGHTYKQKRHWRPFREGNFDFDLIFDFTGTVPALRLDQPAEMTFVDKLDFDPTTAHFHDKSCTFHGSAVVNSDAQKLFGKGNAVSIDVVLQFSRDMCYISDGYVESTQIQTKREEFPLDGEWEVCWEDTPHATEFMYLREHRFSLFGIPYQLQLGDNNVPCFVWPISGLGTSIQNESERPVQTATEAIVPNKGPEIGDSILWTTTDPTTNKIEWIRRGFSSDLPATSLMFVTPGRGLPVYERDTVLGERSAPAYCPESPWGNTFCQGFKVGLASYHFGTELDTTNLPSAYISYEHPSTSQWPPLDDGSPVPSRVEFRNTIWNATTRVFKGDICWEEDYGTTWQGCRKWTYSMKFNPTYTYIISGHVDATLGNALESTEMSVFGNDLVYVNAAIENHFRTLLASRMANSEDDAPEIQRHNAFREMRAEWEEQGASIRSSMMLGAVLTKILANPEENVIDLNL